MQKRKRVVVKVGTKVITAKDRTLDIERVTDIVCQIAAIRKSGIDIILVSSGAIGAGLGLLNMKKRPDDLSELQAAASIGQNYLMHIYGSLFKNEKYLTGQILLTQEDFNDRQRFLNIKHTINALLKHNAIPIINENDTVATEEIRCGDNDRLSSLVADLCEAQKLVILSDVDGLLDEKGGVIPFVHEITPGIIKLGGKSYCDLGTGGMATKIASAKSAVDAGIECVIANGRLEGALSRIIIEGKNIGTTFKSRKGTLIAKKRWIAVSSGSKGEIRVDDGARTALAQKDKSLLASGIVGVKGAFAAGDVVKVIDKDRREFAKGISNYSSEDILKIKGRKSAEFKNILGYKGHDEVIHKDNLVII